METKHSMEKRNQQEARTEAIPCKLLKVFSGSDGEYFFY